MQGEMLLLRFPIPFPIVRVGNGIGNGIGNGDGEGKTQDGNWPLIRYSNPNGKRAPALADHL
jgi:hypothetical protein